MLNTQKTVRPVRGRTLRRGNKIVAAAVTGALLLSGMALGANPASAYQGSSFDGTTFTLSNGTTVTSTLAAGAAGSPTPGVSSASGAVAGGSYTPANAFTARPSFGYLSGSLTNMAMNTWLNYGTMTLTFSQPVTNPKLHLGRMMQYAAGSTSIYIAQRVSIASGTPTAPTFQKESGFPGWDVTETSIAPQNDLSGTSCAAGPAGTSRGGCGSVSLQGTFTSVTLNLDVRRSTPDTGTGNSWAPVTYYSITVDEDLAGGSTALPASYGPASHQLSGLALGASVTADSAGLASGATPTVQTTDTNDALTAPLADAQVGTPYPVTVPITGLASGTAVTAAWLDGNRNGTFDDGERVAVTGGNGSQSLTIPVSALTSAGASWLRLRTAELAADVTSPTGFAATGEVEDWALTIAPAAAPVLSSPATGTALATATPTFSGTGAVAGQTVEVRNAAGTVVGSTTSAADGSWTLTASALPEGDAVFTAFVVDAGGTSSAASNPTSVTIDTIAPDVSVLKPSNGTSVTGGLAAAGDAVTFVDGSGERIPGSVVVNGDGTFKFVPDSPLAHDTTVQAIVTDRAGNSTPSNAVTVDAVAPAAPTVNPTNGSVVRGTAEANSLVTIYDAAGEVLGTTTATGDGTYELAFAPAIANGTDLRVTATDASGNESTKAPTTVNSDRVLAPVIDASNGSTLTGAGEAGATVVATLPDGTKLTTTVKPDGTWVIPVAPEHTLADGDEVTATQTNVYGTPSTPGSVTIDRVAPEDFVPELSDGATITGGTVDQTDTVTFVDGAGNPVAGTVTINPDGTVSFRPTTPLTDTDTVLVIVTDAAGNASGSVKVLIDSTAPEAPTVKPTNGKNVAGTAEKGALVTIRDAAGNALGTVTADADGTYSLDFAPAIAHDTELVVTATDQAGNVSDPATEKVDASAVAVPVVKPTQGDTLSGTGVAGNTITATLPDGSKLTTTVKPDGTWSIPAAPALTDGETATVVQTNPAGTESETVRVTADRTPPAALVTDPSNGVVVEGGRADQTDTVTFVDGSGIVIPGVVTINPNGSVSFTPTTPLSDTDIVKVTVTDAAGNVSPSTIVEIDTTAPNAPTVRPTNGKTVAGTAEKEALVTVYDADGTKLGVTTADRDGNYSLAFAPAIADGTKLVVTATDLVGNVSEPTQATVNGAAVATPGVKPTQGDTLSGTGVAGNTITVTLPDGSKLTTTVKPDGTWGIPVAPQHTLADGQKVTVVQTNPEGTDSAPVEVVADRTGPADIVVDLSDGGSITGGLVEDCDTVTVLDGGGDPVPGTVTIHEDGTFTFVPTTPLADGDTVQVVVSDPAGNAGTPVDVTIDSIAPDAPTVQGTNGSVVRGTAEANSTVIIRDAAGTELGRTTATAEGTYALPFGPAIADGTVLSVTATDATGNRSQPATTTVDGSSVTAPYVAPSKGDVLTGTGIAGDTITATLPDGSKLTTTVKPDGTWSIPVAPGHTLTDGDTVSVTETNPVGTVSEHTSVSIDTVAPTAPTLNVSNGTELTGGIIAKGDTLTFVDGNGDPIAGQLTVHEDGTFTFVPETPFVEGDVVRVVVTDAAGNSSKPVSAVIDTTAPEAPTLDTTTGDTLTGCAEPGSTVTIRDSNGRVIGIGTAGSDCRFSIALRPAPSEGDVLSVTVTDAAGNSVTADVTVAGASGGLALTGSDLALPLGAAALLLLVAGVLLAVRRRNRELLAGPEGLS